MEQSIVIVERPLSVIGKAMWLLKKLNPKQLMKTRYGRAGLFVWLCWEIFGVIRVILYAPTAYTMMVEYNRYIEQMVK